MYPGLHPTGYGEGDSRICILALLERVALCTGWRGDPKQYSQVGALVISGTTDLLLPIPRRKLLRDEHKVADGTIADLLGRVAQSEYACGGCTEALRACKVSVVWQFLVLLYLGGEGECRLRLYACDLHAGHLHLIALVAVLRLHGELREEVLKVERDPVCGVVGSSPRRACHDDVRLLLHSLRRAQHEAHTGVIRR